MKNNEKTKLVKDYMLIFNQAIVNRKETLDELDDIILNIVKGKYDWDQYSWHCGTAYCIFGWKQELDARKAAKALDMETAKRIRDRHPILHVNDQWSITESESMYIRHCENTLRDLIIISGLMRTKIYDEMYMITREVSQIKGIPQVMDVRDDHGGFTAFIPETGDTLWRHPDQLKPRDWEHGKLIKFRPDQRYQSNDANTNLGVYRVAGYKYPIYKWFRFDGTVLA